MSVWFGNHDCAVLRCAVKQALAATGTVTYDRFHAANAK
jgi:hypothetical protein